MSILIPALACKVNNQNARPAPPPDGCRWPDETRPYLTVAGPVPLRFEEALPPPDLSARPPAGAPPKPAHPASADIVLPPKLAADSEAAASAPAEANPPPVAAPSSASVGGTPPPPPAAAPAPRQPTPAPILPDDVPPSSRPEDFLPYFQYPGVQTAPESFAPPPSTATYNRQ